MKHKVLKLSTVILPIIIGIAFISAGCQKDDDIFELQIGDENAVIVKEVDGIEFKFCLLNEQGKPATVFNESENFTFQFSFKNVITDTIIVTTEFINKDFFRVDKINGSMLINKGKPYTGTWCNFSGEPKNYKLDLNAEKTIKCPWVFHNNMDIYPLCVSVSKNYLDKGHS